MYRNKLLSCILAFTAVCLLLSGCASPSNEASAVRESLPASSGAPSAEPVEKDLSGQKVALLMSGSANDGSWNQFGHDAVQLLIQEHGCEAVYSENVSTIDQLQAMRDYANKGYDIIIGWGGQFEDDLNKVGAEYPDKQFVIVCGNNGALENVTAVDSSPWQFGYAFGWFSGKVSKTGKVGFITGMEGVATMNNQVGGWRDGAKNAYPDCETTVIYLSDMDDVAEAREATIALAASGCDVIMHELNAARQGVIDVCKEKGIYTIGRTDEDKKFAPEQVLSSCVFHWEEKYVKIVEDAYGGMLNGGLVSYGYHTPDVPCFEFVYDENNAWNPDVITPEMLADYQKEVVEMFVADPIRAYTIADAASGTK